MNDGGPAFPLVASTRTEDGDFGSKHMLARELYYGMSLRDWFAGKAMQGYLATWTAEDGDPFSMSGHIAKSAYAMADAMLAKRT